MRFITSIAAALVEAWDELRVSRLRVMLSLIGVAVAVAALTAVTALGAVVEQSQREQQERYGGRPALLQIMPSNSAGEQPDEAASQAAFDAAAERYGITWTSRVINDQTLVQLPTGETPISYSAFDADYVTMHRLAIREGRWFTDDDAQRFAPAVVISRDLWKQLGSPDLRSHPHFPLAGAQPTTAVVIGVTGESCDGSCLSMSLLFDDWKKVGFSPIDYGPDTYVPQTMYEAWVPPADAQELGDRLDASISAALGDGWQANVNRQDYAAFLDYDPLLPIKLGVGGVAGLVLLLGALGLVNISLVTVKYRVREIGIRRSFGATAGRVFFGVMMESVVATVVAGLIGVALAVALMKSPLLSMLMSTDVQDLPPFPISAAIIGLVSATVVGALAGLVPALVAVRVKPIDAIRL